MRSAVFCSVVLVCGVSALADPPPLDPKWKIETPATTQLSPTNTRVDNGFTVTGTAAVGITSGFIAFYENLGPGNGCKRVSYAPVGPFMLENGVNNWEADLPAPVVGPENPTYTQFPLGLHFFMVMSEFPPLSIGTAQDDDGDPQTPSDSEDDNEPPPTAVSGYVYVYED